MSGASKEPNSTRWQKRRIFLDKTSVGVHMFIFTDTSFVSMHDVCSGGYKSFLSTKGAQREFGEIIGQIA